MFAEQHTLAVLEAGAALPAASASQPVLIVARSREEATNLVRKLPPGARNTYVLVVDKPGDEAPLVNAAGIDVHLNTPERFARKTPPGGGKATGWLFRVTYTGDEPQLTHINYIDPEAYAL